MPRSVIAGLQDKHVFEFLRNYSAIFHRSSTILHSTSSVWETYVLSILTTVWYFHCFLFSFSQMMWYLIWFQFAFPLWLIIFNIFMCHSCIFFDKMSPCLLSIFWLDCFLMLHFENSSYLLDTSPLSDVCFANVFSHSVGWFLLMVSVAVQEFLSLIRSH